MSATLRKTFGFQIGAIVSLVLAILLIAFISMHMVSVRYDREVLSDKQEKLKVITQGLNRGLVSYIEAGRKPPEIKNYFENQAEGIVRTNPRMVVGLYLPEMGLHRFYGQWSKKNDHLIFNNEYELRDSDQFFDIKVSSIKEPKNFVEDRRGDIFLGRAEPVTPGNQIMGTILVAEQVQAPLTIFRSITRAVFLLVPLFLIIGSVATVLILTHLKRGVRRITSGLSAMEKDAGYRLPTTSDELGEISAAINKMAEAVEQKAHLEEQLDKSSRLAALGRLVAGVAHEIRNPLGIMKATIQVMQEEFGDQDQTSEYLVVLNEQVERQNKIIRELLDYAKPVPPIFQPVNINDVLNSVLNFSRSYFQQYKVTVELELADHMPLVNADVEKLKQAFLNLIFNAVEAMPGGGTMKLHTFAGDNVVGIEFIDNGRGIAETDLDRLFDPFFTTKNTGTGLGLATVHKIVEIHRGIIEVDSKDGQGTVIRIMLPVEGQEG